MLLVVLLFVLVVVVFINGVGNVVGVIVLGYWVDIVCWVWVFVGVVVGCWLVLVGCCGWGGLCFGV